jgi:hypothetical protein
MSALHRAADCRTADGPVPVGADSGYADEAGMYVTDEVFLYRVVGRVAAPAGETVELEDCYWLDVVRVPASHLRARRLRVVKPAPVEA